MKRLFAAALALASVCASAAPEVLFDDFSYADLVALKSGGWSIRSKAGHPGVPGATWIESGFTLIADAAQPGNRLLRMRSQSDGTGPGTQQTQFCHARKYLEGTYAARVRFSDEPVSGMDGDPVIQTFYAVSPLRFDYDPEYSELDWEYLPNGGWGSEKTRLYGITWQTVQLDPWKSYNQSHEEFRSLRGWRTLMMQVSEGKARWFIDGKQVAQHGGRNYPVTPMAIAFSTWFSPGGPLPQGGTPRVYEQDVDWVFHAKDEVLSPAQVEAAVRDYRRRGVTREDSVPARGLESRCDF
jgi:hypothetical protein